jgi:pantoate--beta-alanine ligase
VQPDAAYFGEKDYQQLMVIQQTVRDLALPVQIIGVPTVRAPDGLALSSRNAYLSAEERERALVLSATLRHIAEEAANGSDISILLDSGRAAIAAAGFSLDYLVVCDATTLAPITTLSAPARVLVAAKIGKTRLIDNMAVLATTKNECH